MLNDKRYIIGLLIILSVAFALRVSLILRSPLDFRHDEGTFNIIADSILKNKIYSYDGIRPTSWKSPGYPFFLAILYFLIGHNYLMVKIIQALISSSLCILIYILGKQMFSRAVGLISALILAFDLNFIYMPEAFLSENLYIFIFLVGILSLVRMWKAPVFKNIAVSGFVLGLATLVRSEIQFLPIFILFALMLKEMRKKNLWHILKNFIPTPQNRPAKGRPDGGGSGFRPTGNPGFQPGWGPIILCLFFLLPILPWTIRNYFVHHAFVPVTTEGGVALYTSYCPLEGKIFGSGPRDAVTKEAGKLSEAEQNIYYTKQTFRFIRNNLDKIPRLIILKFFYFSSPFDWEFSAGKPIYNPVYVFSLPFFVLGVYSLRRRFLDFSPIFIIILYYFLFGIIFQGTPRWRSCVEPLIIVIAAFGIWSFVKKFRNALIPYATISVFLLINIVTYIYADSVRYGLRQVLQDLGLW